MTEFRDTRVVAGDDAPDGFLADAEAAASGAGTNDAPHARLCHKRQECLFGAGEHAIAASDEPERSPALPACDRQIDEELGVGNGGGGAFDLAARLPLPA